MSDQTHDFEWFMLGIRFCTRHLRAAASLVETDARTSFETHRGDSHEGITKSSQPDFAQRLRDLATAFDREAAEYFRQEYQAYQFAQAVSQAASREAQKDPTK